MKVIPIALNTFRESVRDRVLYNLILFVLLLVGASIFLGELSMSQESKIIVDIGLSAMRMFGVLIAIFIGIGLVYKEIDKRTIYSLLAKPLHRHEFILGKYFGLCLTLFELIGDGFGHFVGLDVCQARRRSDADANLADGVFDLFRVDGDDGH